MNVGQVALFVPELPEVVVGIWVFDSAAAILCSNTAEVMGNIQVSTMKLRLPTTS